MLHLSDGVFEVLSTNGDTHLGGDDWDKVLIDHLANEFKKYHGVDLRQDAQALHRLKEAAEKAKIELSNATQSDINLPFITAVHGQPVHLIESISRVKFEEMTKHLLEKLKKPMEKALKDANLSTSEIDEVVMVGGSTRMSAIRDLVSTMTGKKPNQTVNPDEVVAVGAAIQAGLLAGEIKTSF